MSLFSWASPAAQVIQDAGIEAHPNDADRIGVAIGSGIGGINNIESTHRHSCQKRPTQSLPVFVPGVVINMISGNVSIEYGFKGPNIAVTACTTGTHNIGFGARMIQYGDADVMVVGGAEAATSPITVAGFASMRALFSRNDEPQRQADPGMKTVTASFWGGAGVLVLEEYERAKARGCRDLW